MNILIIDNEAYIRLAAFAVVFAVIALWECFLPRRPLTVSKRRRWLGNLGVTFLNSMLVRLLLPVTAIGMAMLAMERGWGLFNMLKELGPLSAGLISVILLDLTIYTQHVLFHRIHFFWLFHRMHHADLDIDLSTGARFHPVEIFLSMGIKAAAVIAIGAPPWSVLVFEVLLNATSMFNHGNVFLNPRVDRLARLFLVTPDMHRVHHSAIGREMNSNFGFNLPWWDRLFGTYLTSPSMGHLDMSIGLDAFRDRKFLKIRWMLALPFVGR